MDNKIIAIFILRLNNTIAIGKVQKRYQGWNWTCVLPEFTNGALTPKEEYTQVKAENVAKLKMIKMLNDD